MRIELWFWPIVGIACILLMTVFLSLDVKGNGDSMIYHVPGCQSYSVTVIGNHPNDQRFFTEGQAEEAGFRRALNCNI